MARLLVTGGAGFIGANFVRYWLDRHPGERVVVLDALTYAGNAANLACTDLRTAFRFVRGDICDTTLVEHLLLTEQIDTIVHFAAESHVDRSIHTPEQFIRTNVLGTHAILNVARKVWIDQHAVVEHRFHHVSTDEVYGSLGPDDPAFEECTAYAPNSPYSASKAASDHLVRAFHRTYGLQVTTSNCSNNYGPYQFPEKLIPLTIVNMLLNRVLPIYGDGGNRRDWLHVEDHCRAIDLILQLGTAGEVYNIGGGFECENLQLVRLLCEAVDDVLRSRADLRAKYPECPAAHGGNAASLIRLVADRPGHDRRYAVNSDKIRRMLGFQPQISLQGGLRDTLSWYLQNDWWWRAVLDGTYQEWINTCYRSPLTTSATAQRAFPIREMP